MEWYYAENNQQKGPVSEEEFQKLVEDGVIGPETLVWRDGFPSWRPYRQSTAAPADGGLVCSGCGKVFGEDELTRRENGWICRGCEAGTPPISLSGTFAGGVGGALTADELAARDYSVDVSGCLGRSWEMFATNAGPLMGATVLVYLVLFAAGLVPFIGSILSLLIGGPLIGGLWFFFLRRIRGGDAAVGEAFSGFGPRFAQLLLGHVVPSVLTMLCLTPSILLMLGLAVAMEAAGGGEGTGATAIGGVLGVFAAVVAMVGVGAFIYLSVCWFFTLPLVMDKGMDFWPAMKLSRRVVGRHFWGTLLLLFVAWLMVVVGFLFCIVGFVVAGPVATGMLAFHFDRVFGELRVQED